MRFQKSDKISWDFEIFWDPKISSDFEILDDKIELQKYDFGSKSSIKIELREIWCWMKNRAPKSSSKNPILDEKSTIFDHFLSVCLKSSKNPVQQGRKSGCWTENLIFRRKTAKKPSKINHFLNFFKNPTKIHQKVC